MILEERTPATAPLSLARVKMSSISEASVELASQETRAIQGVTAGKMDGEHRVSNDPGK